jgi:site-specific recombinase XerC
MLSQDLIVAPTQGWPPALIEGSGGRARIQEIGPLDVRDYLEAAKANGLSTATLKQHMAAIRMLFDHLVTGGVLEHKPALSVNGSAPCRRESPVEEGSTRIIVDKSGS